MDRNSPLPPPQEHAMPPWDSEHNLPPWTAEFSEPALRHEHVSAAPEARPSAPPQQDPPAGKAQRLRKLLRFMAAAVVVGGIALTAAPAPLEVADIPSYIEIECCAVTPEEPEMLRFRYMDYRSLYEDVPTYSEEDFRFYLVDPQGQETELARQKDPDLYRAVYCPEAQDIRDAAYSGVESPGAYFSLNLGTEMWRTDMGPYAPGSQLKIVCEYESDGVIQRMTSTREIVAMPRKPDLAVTVEARAADDGMDSVKLTATLRPQAGDGSRFVFADQAFSRMSFCTRWYDANGVPLDEGWCFAAPASLDWPFPDAYRSGEDYVFIYEGPVRRAAADPAAAYYTLELMLIEENTGWPYRLESDTLPVQDAATPEPSPTPAPTATPAPSPAPTPESRELIIESGKDGFDFRFRLADTDWSVSEGDSVVLGSPSGTESMVVFSVDAGSVLTKEDMDGLLYYRYQQEAENNAAASIETRLNGSGPYDCPVNGYPGRALDFEMSMGDQLFRCKYVFWTVDTRLYGLNLLAFAEDYGHACAVLEELLASFTPAS